MIRFAKYVITYNHMIDNLFHKTMACHDDVIQWKTFSALLAICAGYSLVTGEFPAQRPVGGGGLSICHKDIQYFRTLDTDSTFISSDFRVKQTIEARSKIKKLTHQYQIKAVLRPCHLHNGNPYSIGLTTVLSYENSYTGKDGFYLAVGPWDRDCVLNLSWDQSRAWLSNTAITIRHHSETGRWLTWLSLILRLATQQRARNSTGLS